MAPVNLVALQPVSQFSRRLGALQLCRLWSISSLILRLQWSSSPFSLIPLGMLLCSCLFLVLPLFFLRCSPLIRLFTWPAFSSCSTLFSSQNLVSFKPSCLLFPVLESINVFLSQKEPSSAPWVILKMPRKQAFPALTFFCSGKLLCVFV